MGRSKDETTLTREALGYSYAFMQIGAFDVYNILTWCYYFCKRTFGETFLNVLWPRLQCSARALIVGYTATCSCMTLLPGDSRISIYHVIFHFPLYYASKNFGDAFLPF